MESEETKLNEDTVTAEEKTAKKVTGRKKGTAKKEAPAEKTVEKKTTVRRTKKSAPVVTIETYTTAMWKIFYEADVSAYDGITITAQVNVEGLGVFYIALNAKPDQQKEIMPYEYYLASVTIDTTPAEMDKIIKGGYDYIEALKTGTLKAHGNVAKFLILTEIFK